MEILFGLFGTITGIIVLIFFLVLCWNVGVISKYIRKLYIFEKTKMIESGLIDPVSNKIVKWKFDDEDKAIKRDENTTEK